MRSLAHSSASSRRTKEPLCEGALWVAVALVAVVGVGVAVAAKVAAAVVVGETMRSGAGAVAGADDTSGGRVCDGDDDDERDDVDGNGVVADGLASAATFFGRLRFDVFAVD